MGKSEAKKRADAGGISIGELREMIVKARGKRVECNLNPQLTHEQALPDMDTKRRMTKRSPSIRGRRSSRRSGTEPLRGCVRFLFLSRDCKCKCEKGTIRTSRLMRDEFCLLSGQYQIT